MHSEVHTCRIFHTLYICTLQAAEDFDLIFFLQRLPGTMITLDGGHALHTDNPAAFIAEVRSFHDSL